MKIFLNKKDKMPLESNEVNVVVDSTPPQPQPQPQPDSEQTTTQTAQTTREESTECLLASLKRKHESIVQSKFLSLVNGCVCFLKTNWRQSLCRCSSCLDLYKTRRVEFLLASNDSISFYEERGKTKQQLDENKLIDEQMNKLNRHSQVEFMHNYNDFKQELVDFLGEFVRDGKVVKRENITEFFDNLNDKRKKRKLESDEVAQSNYYCK